MRNSPGSDASLPFKFLKAPKSQMLFKDSARTDSRAGPDPIHSVKALAIPPAGQSERSPGLFIADFLAGFSLAPKHQM
jgi:hypothetical protein